MIQRDCTSYTIVLAFVLLFMFFCVFALVYDDNNIIQLVKKICISERVCQLQSQERHLAKIGGYVHPSLVRVDDPVRGHS